MATEPEESQVSIRRTHLYTARPIHTLCIAALALIAVYVHGNAAAQDTQLLFGDTHLHTSHSTDGYGSGNTTLGPDEAYRYAKGEPVIHPIIDARMQISRPLDFLVVADHR